MVVWWFKKLFTKRAFLLSNRQDVLLGIQNLILTEQCSLENIYTDKDHNALGYWKISAALKLTGILKVLFFLLFKQWHYMKANLIIADQWKQSTPLLFNWVNHTCLARELLHILRFEKLCHPRQGMPASRTSALQEGPSYIRKRLNVKDFTLVMILKCFLGKTKGNITCSPSHLSFNSCFFVSAEKLLINCKYSKPQMLAHQ